MKMCQAIFYLLCDILHKDILHINEYMQSIKLEKVIDDYVFNHKDNSITVITKILEYCKNIENNVLTKPNDIALNYFYELMYIIDFMYKSVGLMMVVSTNTYMKEMDDHIKKYLDEFFSNKQMKKRLIEINKGIDDRALRKIIMKFIQNQSEKLKKIKGDMDTFSNIINTKLEENYVFNVVPEMKKYIDDLPDKILLDRNTYFYLQRKIKNSEIRKQIEKVYFKKTDKCMEDFGKLLLCRHKFAKENGCGTYFEYVKREAPEKSETVTHLINDLTIRIENRSRKEIDRIYRELQKDGYTKKVDLYDIIYYYEKLKTSYLFTPATALNVLFGTIKRFFGISFVKNSQKIKLWNKCVDSYNVVNDYGTCLGIVYFDLEKREGKLIQSPLCIHLCYQHKNILGEITVPKAVLLSGYIGINKKCMTYSDVVLLFREVGTLIQTIAHSTREIYQKSDEFAILMSQIMEYIAWEKDTIQSICDGLDETVCDHILFTRYINFANSLKMRCVNALFDHTIHNSTEFIETLAMCSKEGKTLGYVVQMLYKKIYSEVMSSQEDIINLDIFGINPMVIHQEINGNEGTLYGSILIEILSFSAYSLIKLGKGKDFINKVLCTDVNKLKELLYNFIIGLDDHSYGLYLHEVIGYNEIDTEVNLEEKKKINDATGANAIVTETSGNYFGESDPDSSSDDENIIHIEEKIKN